MKISGISKENLIKLGLGGELSLNAETQFIDDVKNKHKDLQKCKLDIINKGTLKNPKIDLIVKQKIDNQLDYNTYKYYSIPIEPEEKYSSEYQTKIRLFGQLSYYAFDKTYYEVNDNDYFKKFANEKIIGTNPTGTFSRFAFPSNFSNASVQINGLSYNTRTANFTSSTHRLNNLTTGDSNKNFLYAKTWSQSDTSGISVNSFSSFYIPYPNTLDVSNYNAFSIPLKIASLEEDSNLSNQNIKGLLMISTGNGTYSKICYISPHGLKTGYQNTYVYTSGNKINPLNLNNQFVKIPSGIMLKTLLLGSEYYTGNIFPETGITLASEEKSGDFNKNSITGITGQINFYDINSNQHLKQTTPIKDTLFYKFYSGLYSGNKTFNTGTWDGIIPTGTKITMEFLSTELNKEVGLDNKFYFIYSGFGNNDTIDAKCSNFLSSRNQENGLIKNTNIKINGNYIKINGYGLGTTPHESLLDARNNAKYNFFNKISNIIKKWTPEFVAPNKKYKSLIKFLNR